MNKPTVYLAGPIAGLSYQATTGWRVHAKVNLNDAGIIAFSPMRAKSYLMDEREISNAYDTPLSCGKGIVARDRFDTQRVDMVLMNLLGAKQVSIGSCIEMGWADSLQVPIALVMEAGNPHDHAMITEIAGFIVPTLDDGLEVVKAILLP